jgi:hypothetical protein
MMTSPLEEAGFFVPYGIFSQGSKGSNRRKRNGALS